MKNSKFFFKRIGQLFIVAFIVIIFSNSTLYAKTKQNTITKNIFIYKGETQNLNSFGKKKCSWSVDKTKILNVNKKGKIKALKSGKAKVTAIMKNKKYIFKVSVRKKKPHNAVNDQNGDTSLENSVLYNLYIDRIATPAVSQHSLVDGIPDVVPEPWLIINTRDESGVSYSVPLDKITDEVTVTLNGVMVDKNTLAVGDSLEIGYTGKLLEAKVSAIPNIVYIKATR